MRAHVMLLLLVGACSGGAKAPVDGPRLGADPKVIGAEIRADVQEQYDAMADFDIAAWAEHLAPDAIVLGSGPEDVWVGKDAAQAAIEASMAPARAHGATATAKSTSLDVSVADDGESAWTAGELEYSVYSGDATLLVPFRITQLFGRKDGEWKVLVAVFSVPLPNDVAFQRAASGELAALAPIPEGIAAGADGVYTRAAHDLDRATDFVASVSDRADAIFIGSAPGERTVGGAAIRESYGKHVTDGHVTLKKHGDIRVGVAPGGHVGWVLANVDLAVDVDGNVITEPFRAMLVYVEEDGEWRLVQAHLSNGVS